MKKNQNPSKKPSKIQGPGKSSPLAENASKKRLRQNTSPNSAPKFMLSFADVQKCYLFREFRLDVCKKYSKNIIESRSANMTQHSNNILQIMKHHWISKGGLR